MVTLLVIAVAVLLGSSPTAPCPCIIADDHDDPSTRDMVAPTKTLAVLLTFVFVSAATSTSCPYIERTVTWVIPSGGTVGRGKAE